jgi:hypothetical protein
MNVFVTGAASGGQPRAHPGPVSRTYFASGEDSCGRRLTRDGDSDRPKVA